MVRLVLFGIIYIISCNAFTFDYRGTHQTCSTASDCTQVGPRVCVDGYCFRECEVDDDCLNDDFMCSPDGLCKPDGFVTRIWHPLCLYLLSFIIRCCDPDLCGDRCCCDEEQQHEEEEAQVEAVENDISDNSYDHETCTTAADCTNAGPRVCIGGLCYRECNEDDDCLHADFMCSPDGLCKPKGCVI